MSDKKKTKPKKVIISRPDTNNQPKEIKKGNFTEAKPKRDDTQ